MSAKASSVYEASEKMGQNILVKLAYFDKIYSSKALLKLLFLYQPDLGRLSVSNKSSNYQII